MWQGESTSAGLRSDFLFNGEKKTQSCKLIIFQTLLLIIESGRTKKKTNKLLLEIVPSVA